MRSIILAFALLAMFLGSLFAANLDEGHRITVKIDGFEGERLFLAYHLGNQQFILDTTEYVNGKAVFSGEDKLEGGIYLVVMPPENNYFEILIDRDQEFTLETRADELVGGMKVKGSEENEIFYENLVGMEKLGQRTNTLRAEMADMEGEAKAEAEAEMEKLMEEMQASRLQVVEQHPESFYATIIRAMRDPEPPAELEGDAVFYYYRNHFFDQIDFGDKRLLRTPILYGKVTQYVDRMTVQHPDTLLATVTQLIDLARANDTVLQWMTIHLLNKFAKSQIMCQEKVYVAIVDQVYGQGRAWWADEEQTKKLTDRANALRWTLCDRIAPELRLTNDAGTPVSMHGIKRDYTILYFWNYDCGHCKKVTPKLVELYPRFDPGKVALYTISTDGTLEEWRNKMTEYGLDTIGAVNTADPSRESHFDYYYDIRSTPRVFLLDKDKKIIAKQVTMEQLEDILRRELGMEPREATGENEEEETGR